MKIKAIHQIEMTSRCNLACRYCPHPKMKRPKMDMDLDTYTSALLWAQKFVINETQVELNLAGIGESTLHPNFHTYIRMAREYVSTKCKLVLATNGVNMTEQIAIILKRYNVWTWVSLHRPEKAGPAIEILKRYGVLKGVSADPSVSAINWAGQVDWHVSANTENQPCMWLNEGKVIVLSDGSVSQCCLDANGAGIIGDIYDNDVNEIEIAPYSLCADCHLTVPKEMANVA